MGWYDALLKPIMVVVGWIMTGTHWLCSLFMDGDSGLAWVLSIVALVIVMRVLMIPLFVKQIKSSRGMQLMQPDLQRIQRKYKGKTDPISRQRQQEEMMAMYRKNGTNPFSSCLPILVQSPFFLALFRLLNNLKRVCEEPDFGAIGTITAGPNGLACSAQNADLFGAPLSSTFMLANEATGSASPMTIRIVTVVLIVAMSVTTFTTQRQLTMKNIPAAAQDNPMFRAQKMMLYMMPVVFAFSGINFPIGVLLYWLTTNLWSMGQQFIVIRRMPAPGSEAERRKEARKAAKAKKHPKPDGGEDPASEDEAKPELSGQRVQPKRQSRSKRKAKGTPSGGGDATDPKKGDNR
ncbi:MAG: membrane protein insertase YidC [Bifidobacteriaceae bacterium]|jgi:YidC/Oxa1 family membrane protein insertase|nr:membrane protein insertase YidC [Bifidobacteriaceae bacterium]